MRARLVTSVWAALIAAGLAVSGQGQEPTAAPELGVGDVAPPLSVREWLAGDPVARFESGKIYWIEFWSLRSPRCRYRLRHLERIQSKYADKGLRVILVTGDYANSALDGVKTHLTRPIATRCTFAWDWGGVHAAYMTAARETKFPCAFLIGRDGKIAFQARRWTEVALHGLLAGDWDPKDSARKVAAAKKRLRTVQKRIAKDPSAVALVREFREQYPYRFPSETLDEIEFRAELANRHYDAAYAAARRRVDAATAIGDAAKLNAIAWAIVRPDADLAKRDLDLARSAAETAVRLTRGKRAAIVDTLARVFFWRKDWQRAIEWQQQAVDLSKAPGLRKTLDAYRAAGKRSL